MARVPETAVGENVYERIMGNRPEILEEWFKLDALMRFSGTLEPSLKEEVRRVLASGVGCTYCASLGQPDAKNRDTKTALAVAFAEALWAQSRDLQGIDDAVFAVLAEEFSVEQIVELTCWVLFLFAAQGFGAVMKLPAATDQELEGYLEWRREGVSEAAAASA
jgi:alkylhydroperoxidase family enzyme